jgi:adenine-specific DNA-methyltransferase
MSVQDLTQNLDVLSLNEEKHQKGQYFTTNINLKKHINSLILNNPSLILEPSIGQGDLVQYISQENENISFDMYEIDSAIQLLENINEDDVIYGDFLQQDIDKEYTTIVGNPPYVKIKHGNLYIDFIERCFHLLTEKGELIFIVPSDFLKLTHSSKIINEMMEQGTFTHIIHPNKENLFKEANIDVIIFRYCKDTSLPKKCLVNDKEKYLINTNGIITFSDNELLESIKTVKDYFDVYVGMVTGKEDVFKNTNYGNIKILNDKDKLDSYILLDEFPTEKEPLNKYLLKHKSILINRKIKKFNEDNWFQWGALRNYNTIKEKLGQKCIYVKTLTRKSEVAFIGKVQLFGGGLLIMIPKEDSTITVLQLHKITHYLNSEDFKKNYTYSGRFKIGHKLLCNSLLNIPS